MRVKYLIVLSTFLMISASVLSQHSKHFKHHKKHHSGKFSSNSDNKQTEEKLGGKGVKMDITVPPKEKLGPPRKYQK